MKKKKKIERLTLHGLKTYFQFPIIKLVWDGCKAR